MNRLVYLWELDSVRDKDAEKKQGVLMSDAFKAIHREIVEHGNSVAVTMNQLTDSSFFAQVFGDEHAYACILRLFELGALRVSIFRGGGSKIRTASQYVQNALATFEGAESKFIFSNFPIKDNDPAAFKETVLNALRYSDLSELRELYLLNKESDPALSERIGTIIKFVNIILMLSVSETANLPPKNAPDGSEEKKPHSFVQFMREVLKLLSSMKSDGECAELYLKHGAEIEKAFRELTERTRALEGSATVNMRSAWLNENKVPLFSGLTEEMIHICYNYTVEDSINGVLGSFDKTNIAPDLYKRIEDYYARLSRASLPSPERVRRRRFNTMLRFAEYRAAELPVKGGRYSEVYHGDRLKWRGFIILKCIRAFAWAFFYIALFFSTELLVSLLENAFSLSLPNGFMTVLINVVAFGIIGSLIGFVIKKINKNHDVPDIFESIVDIFIHAYDMCLVIFGGKK